MTMMLKGGFVETLPGPSAALSKFPSQIPEWKQVQKQTREILELSLAAVRGAWHHRAFARGEHPREYHGVAPPARSRPRAVFNPFEVQRRVLTAIRRWCASPPRLLSLCLEVEMASPLS